MQSLSISSTKQVFKEFKEFSRQDKEKIASVVESKSNEFMLSPAIDSFVYCSSRAVDFGDYNGLLDSRALYEHAINKNADLFDYREMHEIIPERGIERYKTFAGSGMYTNHNSKDVTNSIGFIFDSFCVESEYTDMHVSILFGIDKTKAPRIARDLETYPQRVATSMGATISASQCVICGEPSCDHLRYLRNGKINGKKVAEYLLGFEFFEDSIVSTPACHTAYVIDAISTIIPGRVLKIASQSDEGTTTLQIMKSIYDSIKTASTIQEKNRLSDNLDRLIFKLETLAENN